MGVDVARGASANNDPHPQPLPTRTRVNPVRHLKWPKSDKFDFGWGGEHTECAARASSPTRPHTRAKRERRFGVRRSDPSEGGLRERLRDGSGRPDAAPARLRVSPRSALPIVCLPGFARTAADFHSLAAALAADPAKPRRVFALDYRGHGRSDYDINPDNYTTVRVALADLSAVLIALELAPAIFVGTSYGGLLAMMLAVLRPTAIAGVILNDIGPVIEPQGLVRIKGHVGNLPSRATSRRERKSCAGCSAPSSRSSHRRIGSRCPSHLARARR